MHKDDRMSKQSLIYQNKFKLDKDLEKMGKGQKLYFFLNIKLIINMDILHLDMTYRKDNAREKTTVTLKCFLI